eukprot:1149403-Pelagomonas_calceolata.AAC.8
MKVTWGLPGCIFVSAGAHLKVMWGQDVGRPCPRPSLHFQAIGDDRVIGPPGTGSRPVPVPRPRVSKPGSISVSLTYMHRLESRTASCVHMFGALGKSKGVSDDDMSQVTHRDPDSLSSKAPEASAMKEQDLKIPCP